MNEVIDSAAAVAAGTQASPAASPAPTAPVGLPLWLLAEVTYRCPLQCPYCSNPLDFARQGEELGTADWVRAMGAAQIGFSGGEPLVRPELIAEARRLGYYTNLITSGIGLDEAKLDAFERAVLDHIQISFQSSDEQVNNMLAGSDKAFAHKLAMARAVKAHGYPMVLNFVTHRYNIDHIDRIIELCIALEADFVELATCQFYGWAYLNREALLPTREQLARAERITNEYREKLAAQNYPCKLIFVTPDYYEERPKACMSGWGSIFLTVTPDGTALPCPATARGSCRSRSRTCASTTCATSGTTRSASTASAARTGCPSPAAPATRSRRISAAAAARPTCRPAMPRTRTRFAASRLIIR